MIFQSFSIYKNNKGFLMESKLTWKNKMQFLAQTRGHENILDAKFEHGGLNQGPTPKELVLQAIAGCSGMDAIIYLKKYKFEPLSFDIQIEAIPTIDKKPSYFQEVRVKYNFLGDTLPKEKVIAAVETSMTKYCGVSFMIVQSCPIYYVVVLNGEQIFEGQSKFE